MKVSTPLRATAVAAALALGLAACGGGGDDGDNQSAPEPSGEPGGEYSTELTEPSYLAPSSKCYESECGAVLQVVNDPLVTVDNESGELIYDGLAESIEPNEDQSVWTVTLKEGRTFHNGEPVDAASFERGWAYSGNPKNAVDTAGFMSRVEGAGEGKDLEGFEVVDETTFEVTLNGPFSQFGQQLSYGPAFAPLAQACADDLKTCNEEPIGTGPYMMDGPWQHDQAINLVKWDDYAGDRPAQADTINFQMFTDPTAAFRDFQNGGIDVISIQPSVYLEAKQQLGDSMIEEPTSGLTYIGFPVNVAPFDQKEVRQAISMSIDRELINEQVFNGTDYPSTDIVTPPIPGSRDDACEYCTYDPEAAKQLLADAGVDPAGETIEWYFNAGADHELWVEPIARQVQENLGFDYKLRGTEWAQYLELLGAKNFKGPFRLGWGQDYPSPENYVRPIVSTDGDSNYTGYANSELDDLLVQGDEAATLEEGLELYQQADDLALEDMPILPLWSGSTAIAFSDQVGDVTYNKNIADIDYGAISVNQ